MKRIKKWWMPVLLGGLLMATLVGVAGARPMRQTSYKVSIPAGHFHPAYDRGSLDYWNNGIYMEVDSGYEWFTAAVPIALPGRFTVEKLTLFAKDQNLVGNVCVTLYRTNLYTGSEDNMANVCTTDQFLNNLQVQSTTNISPDTIYGGHGAYLWLDLDDDAGCAFYGVQLQYH